ncbi:MAG: hypothetical protein R2856_12425 [Caldilineaceae bacterium]
MKQRASAPQSAFFTTPNRRLWAVLVLAAILLFLGSLALKTRQPPAREDSATPTPPSPTVSAATIAPPAAADTQTNDMIVIVNGDTLDSATFERMLAIDSALAALLGSFPTPARSTLEQWINRTLLFQANPVTAPPANVTGEIDKLLARNRHTRADLNAVLAAAGVNEADFEAYFASLLRAQGIVSTAALTDLQTSAHQLWSAGGGAVDDGRNATSPTAYIDPACRCCCIRDADTTAHHPGDRHNKIYIYIDTDDRRAHADRSRTGNTRHCAGAACA